MANIVILFVFGAVIGSFLNVIGLRWDTKYFLGRSRCSHCNKILRWYELIPILSFLFLLGRCRGCGGRISFQYPLVEIWTGLIFVTVPTMFIPVLCLYIVISIYDFHHKIIPNSMVYSSIILNSIYIYSNLMAGLVLFSFFALIWLLSRGRAMGFGDAKLALSAGLLLGMIKGLYALMISFWIGAAVGILLMIFKGKDITMKTELPFAPFLVLGIWLSLIFDLNFLHVF